MHTLSNINRLYFAIPGIIYFAIVAWYAQNIPINDDFNSILDSVLRIKETSTGYFAQHNEHRIVILRAIATGYYSLFGEINFYWLTLIGNLFIVGIGWIFYKAASLKDARFLLLIYAVLFSYGYFESMIWATAAISNYGVIFFSLLMLYLLNNQKMLLAAVFSFLAVYSQGNGIIALLAGLVLLLLAREYRWAILWLLWTAVLAYFYFSDYINPPHHPNILEDLRHPARLAIHFAATAGSFIPIPKVAVLLGTALIVLFLFIAIKLAKNRFIFSAFLFVWATLAALSLTRSGFGYAQGASPRYAINSAVLIVLLMLGYAEVYRDKIKVFIAASIPYTAAVLLLIATNIFLLSQARDYFKAVYAPHQTIITVEGRRFHKPIYPEPIMPLAMNTLVQACHAGVYCATRLAP